MVWVLLLLRVGPGGGGVGGSARRGRRSGVRIPILGGFVGVTGGGIISLKKKLERLSIFLEIKVFLRKKEH